MKRLLLLTLSICIFAFSFASCTAQESVNNSVSDIATAVADVSGILEQKELTQDNLRFDLALTIDNIVEFKGYTTNVTGNSGTILCVKVQEGKTADVLAELEAYRTTNAEFLSLYPEFETAQTQAENGRIVSKADVIVFAIAGPDADYVEVDTAIQENLQ